MLYAPRKHRCKCGIAWLLLRMLNLLRTAVILLGLCADVRRASRALSECPEFVPAAVAKSPPRHAPGTNVHAGRTEPEGCRYAGVRPRRAWLEARKADECDFFLLGACQMTHEIHASAPSKIRRYDVHCCGSSASVQSLAANATPATNEHRHSLSLHPAPLTPGPFDQRIE